MDRREEDTPGRREYPPLYEKLVPIALVVLAVIIVVLILIVFAVLAGLFPGGG